MRIDKKKIGFLEQNRSQKLGTSQYPVTIDDSDFVYFQLNFGGGFFFENAFLIYPNLQNSKSILDFNNINNLMKSCFCDLIKGALFWGCEIFGNQFAFKDGSFYFFNIETAEFEFMGNSFDEVVVLLKSETEYFTGKSLLLKWQESYGIIANDERLCPKRPFVVGGEYEINNLYKLNIGQLIKYNGALANKISGLQDGTIIDFEVTE